MNQPTRIGEIPIIAYDYNTTKEINDAMDKAAKDYCKENGFTHLEHHISSERKEKGKNKTIYFIEVYGAK